MDYGRILHRAWEITWRWKILWLLGFLAVLGNGGRGGSNFNYQVDSAEEMPGWFQGWSWEPSPQTIGWAIVLGFFGLLLGLALWALSIIARGGLIGGVVQVEEEGSTSLGRAWRAGRDCFWSLLGVAVLTFLPLLMLGLLLAGLALFFIFGVVGVAALRSGDIESLLPFLAPGACAVPFCVCGMLLLVAVLNQLRIYAENAVVLEGRGWIDAVQRAWQVLRENLAPTLVLWLIFLAIGLLVLMVVGGLGGIFFAPFAVVFGDSGPGSFPWPALILGGLVLGLLGALVGSVVQVFTSATWTLTYRRLVGLEEPAAEEAG
ncbi:MAG: hypothetical protein JXA37_03260 [Chloroflexia bacterium]|nr:hypothetical protein [Chloroflexia bacterium]